MLTGFVGALAVFHVHPLSVAVALYAPGWNFMYSVPLVTFGLSLRHSLLLEGVARELPIRQRTIEKRIRQA